MTTLSTAAAKRRAARHSRLSKARGRRMAHTDPNLASRTPRPRTRRLRDQDALNLDDCFHHCEELGYHVDPDVHIGRAVVQSVNPFSILDPDSSEFPSSPLNTPSGDETLSEWPEEYYRQTSCSLPYANSATAPDKPNVGFDARPLTNTYTDYMAPGFPHDVFTSETNPIVKMPGSFSPISSPGTDDTFNSGFYLDNIRIPSPLLYRRSSSESGCTPDTETPSDLPEFELTHGQPVPEPDFVTYRNTPHDDVHTSTQTPLLGIYSPPPTNAVMTFLGHKREKPQLRASSSTDSNQTADRGQTRRGSGGSDTLNIPGGFQCYMKKNGIDQEHIYGNPPTNSHHTVKTNDDDLIFPKLSISPQDQPCNLFPWNPNVVKPWHAMAKRSLLRGLEPKCAFTSPSPCRDLVLASTFLKELVLSPGRRWSCDATIDSVPNDGHQETRKVALPLERPKLSIESDYGRQSQRSDTSAGEKIEKITSPLEKFCSSTSSCHGALTLPSPLSEIEDEDEGYFSSNEICTDAEIINLNESDTDWSDWEGDFEVDQINGIDM